MTEPTLYQGQCFEVYGLPTRDGTFTQSTAYVEIHSISITGEVSFMIYHDGQTGGSIHSVPVERIALLRSSGLWRTNSNRWPEYPEDSLVHKANSLVACNPATIPYGSSEPVLVANEGRTRCANCGGEIWTRSEMVDAHEEKLERISKVVPEGEGVTLLPAVLPPFSMRPKKLVRNSDYWEAPTPAQAIAHLKLGGTIQAITSEPHPNGSDIWGPSHWDLAAWETNVHVKTPIFGFRLVCPAQTVREMES